MSWMQWVSALYSSAGPPSIGMFTEGLGTYLMAGKLLRCGAALLTVGADLCGALPCHVLSCPAGGKRGIGLNEERDQTLNQLLTGGRIATTAGGISWGQHLLLGLPLGLLQRRPCRGAAATARCVVLRCAACRAGWV
jgi:hypothetical protein